jgi:thymidylate kinase
MRIVPVYVWDKLPSADKKDGLVSRSEQPALRKVIEQRGIRLRRPQEKDSYFLDRIALDSRVLIIEGIAGSGKDTLQSYLKKKLKDRVVYDYSEGELLHSWKHFPIEGILKLRLKFIKLFVKYVRDIIYRNENAVFLLNRFHLSTYVTTIIRQPELEREYNEIINVLRTLPVHVFILQLDENEIEMRSLHSERSSAWENLQQQMVTKDRFHDRSERYIWQQKLILETAKRQQIPYSVIKVQTESEWVSVPEAQSIDRRDVRMNAAGGKISRKKRDLPRTL